VFDCMQVCFNCLKFIIFSPVLVAVLDVSTLCTFTSNCAGHSKM